MENYIEIYILLSAFLAMTFKELILCPDDMEAQVIRGLVALGISFGGKYMQGVSFTNCYLSSYLSYLCYLSSFITLYLSSYLVLSLP